MSSSHPHTHTLHLMMVIIITASAVLWCVLSLFGHGLVQLLTHRSLQLYRGCPVEHIHLH